MSTVATPLLSTAVTVKLFGPSDDVWIAVPSAIGLVQRVIVSGALAAQPKLARTWLP